MGNRGELPFCKVEVGTNFICEGKIYKIVSTYNNQGKWKCTSRLCNEDGTIREENKRTRAFTEQQILNKLKKWVE